MRLATSSTMAPHWQPKPAPAPLVDAPAAPALSVEAAMRIMFDLQGAARCIHQIVVACRHRCDVRRRDCESSGTGRTHGRVARGFVPHRLAAQNDLVAALQSADFFARVPPRRRKAWPRRARRGHPREGTFRLRPHADDAERAVARRAVGRRRRSASLVSSATNFAPATYERWHAPGAPRDPVRGRRRGAQSSSADQGHASRLATDVRKNAPRWWLLGST